MVRSVALALALTILPGFAVAQQEGAPASADGLAATVVEGSTLRDLALRFYGDAELWNRIYEANRDQVQDPERLEAGQTLRIPRPSSPEMRLVRVVSAEDGVARVGVADVIVPRPAGREGQQVPRGPKTLDRRTVFWPDTARDLGIGGREDLEFMAVSPDVFYGTPWVIPPDASTGAVGTVVGFAGAAEIRAEVGTILPFHEILIDIDGGTPAVGARLHAFRLDDRVPGLGRVARPTGVVTVTAIEERGVVGVVDRIYRRMTVGDLLTLMPDFPLELGQEATEVDDDLRAEVVGFSDPHELQAPGDVVFLDRGSDAGVSVGDEFTVVWSTAPGWSGRPEGLIQAVRVGEGFTAARIVRLQNPVFVRGVQVRLSRRMP